VRAVVFCPAGHIRLPIYVPSRGFFFFLGVQSILRFSIDLYNGGALPLAVIRPRDHNKCLPPVFVGISVERKIYRGCPPPTMARAQEICGSLTVDEMRKDFSQVWAPAAPLSDCFFIGRRE